MTRVASLLFFSGNILYRCAASTHGITRQVGRAHRSHDHERMERTTAASIADEEETTIVAVLCMLIIIGLTVGCMCFWFCPVVSNAQRVECCGLRPDDFPLEDGSAEDIDDRGHDRLKGQTSI
uniref:Uncharacterized protein n=1 Tax=Plectus sambesii TaxID=2011161 RepID=A0A914WCY8_9BILA